MTTKYLPEKFAIKIHNEAHYKIVQERLFALGYKLLSGEHKLPSFDDYEIIYINAKGMIDRWGYEKGFIKHGPSYQIISTDELFQLERKPEFEEYHDPHGYYNIHIDGLSFNKCTLSIRSAIYMAHKVLELHGGKENRIKPTPTPSEGRCLSSN